MEYISLSKHYGTPSIGVNNRGNLKCEDYALAGWAPQQRCFYRPTEKKSGMQVSVMSFDGACVRSCAGNHTREDATLIQNMLNTLIKEVTDYASL